MRKMIDRFRRRLADLLAGEMILEERRCAEDTAFSEGLHTMHERYLKGEPHGLKEVEHQMWRVAKQMGKACAAMMLYERDQIMQTSGLSDLDRGIGGMEFKIESPDPPIVE